MTTAQSTSLGILIDSEALLDARRELLRHEQALLTLPVRAPDTGPTTALTARAFDSVAARVGSVADDLRGLAGALDRLVDDVADQDGQITAMFDLLRMRTMS